MNAASLHVPALVPVAATPTTHVVSGGGAVATGGGITPASGQGFVPASGAAATAAPAPAAGAPQQGQAPAAGQPTIEQLLATLTKELGEQFNAPIIAPDGTIYMERKQPSLKNGKLAISYVKVGQIDKATGKLALTQPIIDLLKAKSGGAPKKELVKVGDELTWQTFTKTEDGRVVAEVTKATEEEVQAYQQQMQQQQAQQAAQAKVQNRDDWQSKLGTISSNASLMAMAGQVANGLAQGPDYLTGRPGSTWMSAWFLANRLNGKAEGKLLPQWLTSGIGATVIDMGLQAYQLLDLPKDIATVRSFLANKPLPAVSPTAMQDLVAKGTHPAMAQALTQLGTEARTGVMLNPARLGTTALVNTQLQAAQLVKTDELHKAMAATDPVRGVGVTVKAGVDQGIGTGLGLLSKLITPVMLGTSAINVVTSGMTVKGLVEKNGVGHLINTQQGRGAVLGGISSVGFLAMYAAPLAMEALKASNPAIAAASAAINIATTVLGGVQALNQYGLFGGEGFMNNDGFRAAFLIPPLTPIGAFAFYMKHKKKKQDEEAAKLAAAKQVALQRTQQQREMAKLQLEKTGAVSGAAPGADGTITIDTGVPNDMKVLAAQLGGAGQRPPAQQQQGQAPAAAQQQMPPGR